MIVEMRIVGAGLAAFAGVGLITSLLLPWLTRRWVSGPAAQRARQLARLRLLPATTAGIAGVVTYAAFLAFEPRVETEDIGFTVPILAAFGALLVATSLLRIIQMMRTTNVVVRGWMKTAQRVDLPGISIPAFSVDAEFPVVSVVGLVRPRLLIARSVLSSCSQEELRAILAHEQGHVERHDNLRRLLISAAPDVLNWLPASARFAAAWCDAAEEAADDDAVNAGTDGRIRLAGALLKVARLAPQSHRQTVIPASALYRGERLDRRVRRLLEPGAATSTGTTSPWPLRIAICVCLVGSFATLGTVHDVVEALIHTLP